MHKIIACLYRHRCIVVIATTVLALGLLAGIPRQSTAAEQLPSQATSVSQQAAASDKGSEEHTFSFRIIGLPGAEAPDELIGVLAANPLVVEAAIVGIHDYKAVFTVS